MMILNPIIPGFHPDPSICRKDQDYYLVTSTFEYFPGLPIFHSRDLVHWRKIGHAIHRKNQVDLRGIGCSRGLFAATIRYHNQKFYVINTLVGGNDKSGNFIVTADDPAGPWSDPIWVEDAPGIDPSLFFDDDERIWICANRDPAGGPSFRHQREIWLAELDPVSMQIKHGANGLETIWTEALKNGTSCEAPHIYKKDGYYYLIASEGGTGHYHAVTVARSERIDGPYAGWAGNPILTHRHLGRGHSIAGTGHADLVETHSGQWWLVALAMRPYGGYHYNLGRETFLAPVHWENGWPLVSLGKGIIEEVFPGPDLPHQPWVPAPVCDHFDSDTLGLDWNTVMDFQHAGEGLFSGVALLQSNQSYFRFGIEVNAEGKNQVCCYQHFKGKEQCLAQMPYRENRIYLQAGAFGQDYWFRFGTKSNEMQTLISEVDGRILNTMMAGGFVGTYAGVYITSHHTNSPGYTDFGWFEYSPEITP